MVDVVSHLPTDGVLISFSETGRFTHAPDERETIGELALEIIHEIRNPLEALSYLNFLALEDADDPEQVRIYLRLASEQIALLSRIATQTLDFVRLAGPPKSIDLVDVAEAALRIHRRTIETKKIHLVKQLSQGLLAECHAGRMLQVVSNLIVNALDALPEGGNLALRLSKKQGRIHLLIADNGHGIAAEHRERIFERFFTTKGDGGTGLGLPLAKRIVEEYDGSLCFRSSVRAGRRGTAFKICLPDRTAASNPHAAVR